MTCSFVIKDLCYSLPHGKLLLFLEKCIVKYGSVAFQNSTGVSVKGFLELLTVYLNSTFKIWDDKLYIQSNGICILSCIAPILSDLFLGHHDRIMHDQLRIPQVTKIFRYVDDFLVVFDTGEAGLESLMFQVLGQFRPCFKPLVLTFELPVERTIIFLDLKLRFSHNHIFWAYEPHASKPLLPFDSSHSKLVKGLS